MITYEVIGYDLELWPFIPKIEWPVTSAAWNICTAFKYSASFHSWVRSRQVQTGSDGPTDRGEATSKKLRCSSAFPPSLLPSLFAPSFPLFPSLPSSCRLCLPPHSLSLSVLLYFSHSLSPSFHPVLPSLPPFVSSLFSFPFRGGPPLNPPRGSGGAVLWAPPEGPGTARPSNDFGAFWCENRPPVSGDSGIEEVHKRRTSIASHKVDQNFGDVRTPDTTHSGCATANRRGATRGGNII